MQRKQTITINQSRYRIIEPISTDHASYSDIWKAVDEHDNRVVVKTVKQKFIGLAKQQQEQFFKHLNNEIGFLKQLQKQKCQHIIELLNSGEVDGLPVLVLPYIPYTLSRFIKTTPRSIRLYQYLDWCVQICHALKVIHKHQRHYRDLKPGNILTDEEGRQLKLIDFGTIKPTENSKQHSFNGTPSRMAPEQMIPSVRGKNAAGDYEYGYDTDERTDFFALGLLLFEFITGSSQLTSQVDLESLRNKKGEQGIWQEERDLGGISEEETKLFRKSLEALYPIGYKEEQLRENDPDATFLPTIENNEDIHQELTILVRRLLARRKEDRPQSVDEILNTLQSIIQSVEKDAEDIVSPMQAEAEAPNEVETQDGTKKYYGVIITVLLSLTSIYFGLKPHKTISYLRHVNELSLDDELDSDESLNNDQVSSEETTLRLEKTEKDHVSSVPGHADLNNDSSQPNNSKPSIDSKERQAEYFDNKPPPQQKIPRKVAVQSRIFTLPKDFPVQNFIVIAKDTFTMGNSRGAPDEKPERKVVIKPFAVSQQLISKAQYRAFCFATQRSCTTALDELSSPVTGITKQQALDFIAYLSKINGNTFRLLSESEWEYLAMHSYDIRLTGLEWVADCGHLNYRNAPTDSKAWLNENGGDCSMGEVRGNTHRRPLQTADRHNRFHLPRDMKKKDVGFRIAISLPE